MGGTRPTSRIQPQRQVALGVATVLGSRKHADVSLSLVVALLFALTVAGGATETKKGMARLQAPLPGKLYHGVYPGGVTGEEDDLTPADVRAYEQQVGRKVAWVYFSHNWNKGRAFPRRTAEWIRSLGAVPFVRLMIYDRREGPQPSLSVEAILSGKLDADLRQWAAEARRFATPLMVEYGTECNGYWFPWNGLHYGAGETQGFGNPHKSDGPERFAAAYRRIVTLMRAEGADNITWVFHVDTQDDPEQPWNRFQNYYPGGDVVDWIAVSAYGPQRPTDREARSFRKMMDRCYPRLEALAKDKPVIVAEFGCTAGSRAADPSEWAGAAMDDLLRRRWPRMIGFSWWNERWENDDDPKHNTTMRVQDLPSLAAAFKTRLTAHQERILTRPLVAAP